MTHAMAKGSDITVPAAAVRAVLRWTPGAGVPDVDAAVLLLNDHGRVRTDQDFIFYNQPRHPSGLARKLPKKRQGDRLTDSVEAQLARQDPTVDRLVLVASADGGSFAQVRQLRVEVHDATAPTGGEPFAYFDVQPATGAVSAMVCGEFHRGKPDEPGWRFRAESQGYASGLVGLATEFGISVDEAESGHPTPAPGLAAAGGQQAHAPAAAASSSAPPIAYGYPPTFTLPPQGPQFIGR